MAALKGDGVYNIGSGKPGLLSVVVIIVIGLVTLGVEVVPDPGRIRHNELSKFYADNSKAKDELGWAPKIPFESTLKDCIDWSIETLGEK